MVGPCWDLGNECGLCGFADRTLIGLGPIEPLVPEQSVSLSYDSDELVKSDGWENARMG